MATQHSDPNRPKAAPVRSYTTRFERDEDPISEGGMWLNGLQDGLDWADVTTKGGMAYGQVTKMLVAERRTEQGNLNPSTQGAVPVGDYDDPTSVLTGSWGPNQFARARVVSRNPTDRYFQEVEIRLRSSIMPHSCTGYEVFWRCLKTDEGYAEIVRWNGKNGDFTSLNKLIGTQYGVKDGDLVEASVFGNVIKGFINGVEVISATDDVYAEGSPGIGYNFGVGDTNVDHGFSEFEVDTFNA